MKTEHTPGPWHIGKCSIDLPCRSAVRDKDGWEVAVIPGLTIDQEHPKQDANARLIAAAPELLAALKLIKNIVDAEGIGSNRNQSELAVAAMESAIAKAEGGE